MKLLRCKLCRGEMDIVGHEHSTNKKVKCRQCGYNNENKDQFRDGPEIIVIRRR